MATIDVSFISLAKVLPAVARLRASRRRRAGDGQAAVRGRPRAGRQGRRRPRRRRPPRRAALGRAPSPRSAASRSATSPRRGCRGRRATARPSSTASSPARSAATSRRRSRGSSRDAGRRSGPRSSPTPSPSRPPDALRRVAAIAAARPAGSSSRRERSVKKHGDATAGLEVAAELPEDVDLCLVLGGDGTILKALRTFAGTDVPVFAVNFGTIGFLAAAEREALDDGVRAAFEGAIEVIDDPGPRGRGRRPPAARPQRPLADPHARTRGSPSSATSSAARRSGTSAATASSSPPRSARPDTTSPTRGRSSPGGSRATSSRSSPRTRSPPARSSSPRTTSSGHQRGRARRRRRPHRRRARRRARERRGDRGPLPRRSGAPRAATRRELLPADQRQVRPPRSLAAAGAGRRAGRAPAERGRTTAGPA